MSQLHHILTEAKQDAAKDLESYRRNNTYYPAQKLLDQALRQMGPHYMGHGVYWERLNLLALQVVIAERLAVLSEPEAPRRTLDEELEAALPPLPHCTSDVCSQQKEALSSDLSPLEGIMAASLSHRSSERISHEPDRPGYSQSSSSSSSTGFGNFPAFDEEGNTLQREVGR